MREGEGIFPQKNKVVWFFHALLPNLYSNVVPHREIFFNKRVGLQFFTK